MPILFIMSIIFLLLSIYAIVENSVYNSIFLRLTNTDALVAYIFTLLYSLVILIKCLFDEINIDEMFSKKETIMLLISFFMYISLIPLTSYVLNRIVTIFSELL